MFVIPCKYSSSNNTIFECVESIKRVYPTEKIVVVDSCSEDKTYFSKLEVFDILEENPNYEIGAYIKAFDKYPNEEYYYNIHDSLLIKNKFPIQELVTIQWFDNIWDDNEQYSWAKDIFEKGGMCFEESFYGCFGTMFMCSKSIMERLKTVGIDNFKPISKKQSCGMERVLGMMFTFFGYDLRACAVQGKHINFTHNYDESIVKKIFRGRV